VNISWLIRLKVASRLARMSIPPGGIVVLWSHLRSDIAP
jgi:hypothetical protein